MNKKQCVQLMQRLENGERIEIQANCMLDGAIVKIWQFDPHSATDRANYANQGQRQKIAPGTYLFLNEYECWAPLEKLPAKAIRQHRSPSVANINGRKRFSNLRSAA